MQGKSNTTLVYCKQTDGSKQTTTSKCCIDGVKDIWPVQRFARPVSSENAQYL